MKKIILCGALFNLICTQVQALQASDSVSKTIPSKTKSSVTKKAAQRAASTAKKQPQNKIKDQIAGLKQSSPIAPNTQIIEPETMEQQKQSIINCDSRISPETTSIEQDFILSWAAYAVTQSFDFNLASLDTQLRKLQSCYTKKGWVGFTAALQKSGNIDAIKTQNLRVSSKLDGAARLIEANDNQWKIILPLKVVYQNDEEEETHFLNIYLIIGWKNAFGLGITQMIATPRSAPLSQKAATLKDALQSVYIAASDKRTDGVQQIATPFVASLFQKESRASSPYADIIHSQADLTQERQKSQTTRETPHLAQLRPAPVLQNAQIAPPISRTQNKIASVTNHAHEAVPDTAKMNKVLVLNEVKSANPIFDFKPAFQASLQKLQGYGENGWNELQASVQKLSYIEAIKTPKLTVNSPKDRQPQLIETQNNQWNITLPMQVVYQNDKNKVSQLLNVNLTVGRTRTGELGIMQVAAAPNGAPSQTTKISSNQDKQREHLSQKAEPNNTSRLAQALTLHQPVSQKAFSKPSQKPGGINCNYKIPAENTKIDEELVLTWAKKATAQSFDFNSSSIDTQLQELQSCYTEKGWNEFKTALQKSGNIEAIKIQKLVVNSEVDGQPQLLETKDNQWKVTLPLHVAYQNDKDKLVQLLNVNLTIGRKITGELGIMQMIATPRVAPVTSDTTPTSSPKELASHAELTQKMPENNTVQQSQSPSVPVEQQPQKVEIIRCDYKIPAETQKIDDAVVLSWAVQAALQSFDFNFASIDTQLQQLQPCYTEKGWDEFKSALQKAGNIEAFRTQKLTAISQMDGRAQLIESQGNQWRISLPLHVVYQNDKGSTTQLLNVNLIVVRKPTGELGIIQLNSSLRAAAGTPESPRS
ncbi:DotI/IcmL family type IV secretion protein [Legionella maioricensis]|uniref:DotI/IcmL family type IV secretion protein n=1 Tax=Legionella maioricensis TaxID=2896528 RepID=A0A9X2I936_9GAMM|nr:DotI/IcmL family type IV secretion protein [Legionella maioricensis]MCL9682775.1 DotI/IcmL family type IV secretion protein [Legionella maioricensis]MCL9686597.1 DotI/IcmL family type IV secretion protein [Legionella maioricensis]